MVYEDDVSIAILSWIQSFHSGSTCNDLKTLSDGIIIWKMLNEICPEHFDINEINLEAENNWALASSNIRLILRSLDNYFLTYQKKNFHILDSIDVKEISINKNLNVILNLIDFTLFLALFNNEKSEEYVAKILNFNDTSQAILKHIIEDLMSKGEDLSEDNDNIIDKKNDENNKELNENIIDNNDKNNKENNENKLNKIENDTNNIKDINENEIIINKNDYLELKNEKLLYENEINKLNDTISSLKLSINNLIDDKKNLELLIKENHIEKLKNFQQNDYLENENLRLKKDTELTNTTTINYIREIENENKKLIELNTNLNTAHNKLSVNYIEIKNNYDNLLKDNELNLARLLNINDENEILKEKLNQLNNYEENNKKLLKKLENYNELKNENNKNLTRIEEYLLKINELEKKINIKNENISSNLLVEQLKNENNNINSLLNQEKDLNSKLRNDVILLEKKIKWKDDEILHLNEKLKGYEYEIESLNSSVNVISPPSSPIKSTSQTKSIEILEDRLKNYIQKIEEYEKLNTSLQLEINQLKSSTTSTTTSQTIPSTPTRQVTKVETDILNTTNLQNEIDILIEKKKKSENELLEKSTSLTELQCQLNIKQHELNVMKTKIKEVENDNQVLKSRYKSLLQYSKNSVEPLKGKLVAFKSSLENDYKLKVASLNSKYDRLNAKYLSLQTFTRFLTGMNQTMATRLQPFDSSEITEDLLKSPQTCNFLPNNLLNTPGTPNK